MQLLCSVLKIDTMLWLLVEDKMLRVIVVIQSLVIILLAVALLLSRKNFDSLNVVLIMMIVSQLWLLVYLIKSGNQ